MALVCFPFLSPLRGLVSWVVLPRAAPFGLALGYFLDAPLGLGESEPCGASGLGLGFACGGALSSTQGSGGLEDVGGLRSKSPW